jgi:hypothetical protein
MSWSHHSNCGPKIQARRTFRLLGKRPPELRLFSVAVNKSPAPGQRGRGGGWHADLTGIGLGKDQWNFRQLFVNGGRAVRAHFPNVTETNPFLYATGAVGNPKGAFDHLVINPALIKPSWGTAADAQINVVPQSRFFNQ